MQRAVILAASDGYIGVLSSRLGFFLEGLEEWRRQLLGGEASLDMIADLGYGVLDAVVETAAYTIRKASFPQSVTAISVLSSLDKVSALQQQLDVFRNARQSLSTYSMPQSLIRSLPSSVIAYWLPPHFADRIRQMKTFENADVRVYSGLQSDHHFRFLRLWWETPPGGGTRWVPFAKGGEYQPFADDLHLVVNWADDGAEMKAFVASKYRQWSRHIKNTDRYFRSGLTFTERTTSDLSVRAFPQGAIFSVSGPAIQSDSTDDLFVAWGLLASRVGRAIIEIAIGSGDTSQSGTAARHYRIRVVSSVPFPELRAADVERVKTSVIGLYEANLGNQVTSETHRLYCRGARGAASIRMLATQLADGFLDRFAEATKNSEQLESIVDRVFGLSAEESLEIAGPHPARQKSEVMPDVAKKIVDLLSLSESDLCSKALAETPYSRNATKKTYYFDRRLELISLLTGVRAYEVIDVLRHHNAIATQLERDTAIDELSFAVGCAFGRWDVRCDGAKINVNALTPFEELPTSSPMSLRDSGGIPLKETPPGYPIRVEWEGLMPDDSEHTNDIVRRVRDVLEVVWKDGAEKLEKEACTILGVTELRDYFRNSNGFWDHHISRYSKSRRKAPIYWLLQSSRKNYSLWIYYQRLDRDLLFKALVNYIEPKARLESSRLENLRNQLVAAGGSSSEARRIAKEIERQEDFISELREFEDRLRRAANLHLVPDLNDGVILNIALLHELVPWKEAKNHWIELLKGEHDWSSIGQQLRQKGLVK